MSDKFCDPVTEAKGGEVMSRGRWFSNPAALAPYKASFPTPREQLRASLDRNREEIDEWPKNLRVATESARILPVPEVPAKATIPALDDLVPREELDRAIDACKQMMRERNEYRAIADTFSRERDELRVQLENSEAVSAHAREAFDAAVDDLHTKLAARKKERDEAREALAAEERRYESLETTARDLRVRLQVCEKERDEASIRWCNAESDLHDARAACEGLTRERDAAQAKTVFIAGEALAATEAALWSAASAKVGGT